MITVTEHAAEYIKKVQCDMKKEGKNLRVSIINGGCSGNQYKMDFDTNSEGDTKFNSNGVTILVDKCSYPLVNGMELDRVEDLKGGTFIFKNPNVAQECCCGQSFSV